MTPAREKYANREFIIWAVTGIFLLNIGIATFGKTGAVAWGTGMAAGMLYSELGDRLIDQLVTRREVKEDV